MVLGFRSTRWASGAICTPQAPISHVPGPPSLRRAMLRTGAWSKGWPGFRWEFRPWAAASGEDLLRFVVDATAQLITYVTINKRNEFPKGFRFSASLLVECLVREETH